MKLAAPDVELERVLFARYRETGDVGIRNDFVERHRGLAVTLAHRFNGRGEPLDDLMQVAMIGLLGAVERFEPAFGNNFITFATPTILGELRRHFRDHSWAVKVPRPIKDLHLRVGPAVDDLRIELGRAPTVPELAAHLGCTVEKAIEALDVGAAYRPQSLHVPLSGGDGLSLGEQLPAAGDPVHSFELRQTVRSLVASLPERERMVIRLRFYDELTQADIAKRIGVSQMQVSRIVRATLERLSHLPGVREA